MADDNMVYNSGWNFLEWTAMIFLIIGGLNWGLTLFNFNLVTAILGSGLLSKIVFGLVGAAAVYAIIDIIFIK